MIRAPKIEWRMFGPFLLACGLLTGLWLTNLYGYLLFHGLAEWFSVAVAVSTFMLVWNSRRFLDDYSLLFLGIGYLFIGAIDLVHTLAYKGMGVFPGYGTNLATQLWLAARYMESLTFLIAPLLSTRKFRPSLVLLGYAAATALLLLAIFYWEIFPTCFVEKSGLTLFKIFSEYVVCLILLASIALFFWKKDALDYRVFRLLIASIIVTIASELAFTIYDDPHAPANMFGHFLKIVSFYLVYRALIVVGLREPYNLLYRSLKQSENELRAARERLEEQVRARTADLERTNVELREEIAERRRLEQEILNVSEAEQHRIGQDLHDGLGQQLTGVGLKCELLARSLAEHQRPEATMATQIEALVRDSISQTRRLAKGLSPVGLDAEGLMTALKELAIYVDDLTEVACVFRCDSPVAVEDSTVAIHLYRIAQEAVNNAAKHANPKHITLSLIRDDSTIRLTVEDDGAGFALDALIAPGMGLRIMQGRARTIGGVCEIQPRAGGGTIVRCTCPAVKSSNDEAPEQGPKHG